MTELDRLSIDRSKGTPANDHPVSRWRFTDLVLIVPFKPDLRA